MFRSYIAALFLSCFSAIAAKEPQQTCPDGKKHYRATVRHIESGGIGYNKGYSTVETFFSADPSRWSATPFLDVRGHVFNDGQLAANAGIGLRSLWKERVYGINTYYDYRNTSHFHYNQIGAGLESLGEFFDFRINGYLPVGKKISNPLGSPETSSFSGHHLILSQKHQIAMKGADAEFGFHFGKTQRFEFYAAAGPYYFIGELGPNVWGGKARIAGTYNDWLTLQLSDSYDATFHNKFQGQISLNFSFGPKSKIKRNGKTCELATPLNSRMVQPIDRQEIIVVDKKKKKSIAIDPATGQPYFFVFVNNTSSSDGTFESPYPTFAQAQANSSPNDIIYVFPGNGTTQGMNEGIALQANQKFWGSGVSHLLLTTQGVVTLLPQSASAPIITSMDADAVTLATNNEISGFTISEAMNNGIFGNNPESVQISSCTFIGSIDHIRIESSTTNLALALESCTFQTSAEFSVNVSGAQAATISVTNNQFQVNNAAMVFTLDGTSSLNVTGNTFNGQTSVSSASIALSLNTAPFSGRIENNVFSNNECGSITVNYRGSATEQQLAIANNMFVNNGIGSLGFETGSNIYIDTAGQTVDSLAIFLSRNTFRENAANSLYVTGTITDLQVTALNNTMTDNGRSALAIASAGNTLNFNASNNTIMGLRDNGIGIVGNSPIQNATIMIDANTIADITISKGIAIAQQITNLNCTITNNTIQRCEDIGIGLFSPGFTQLTATISGNTIEDCLNVGGNAAGGLDIETYVNFTGTVANNTLSGNNPMSPGVAVGVFTTGSPIVTLNLTDNSCTTGYTLTNPMGGTFCVNLTGNTSGTDYQLNNDGMNYTLAPCNADSLNTGTINTSGTITSVAVCDGPTCL